MTQIMMKFQTQKEIDRNVKKDKLNESLGLIGISPVKTHGLAKGTKINVAREKLERSFETQKEIVAGVFDVEKAELLAKVAPADDSEKYKI